MTSTLVKIAEEMFFRAMEKGYAFGFKPQEHPSLPGWNQYVFDATDDEGNEWRVVDEYNDDGGCTLIVRNGDAIWLMRYYGKYQKEAIPLLKAALAHQYKARVFRGGRGMIHFSHGDDMFYENTTGGTFERFNGHERIAIRITEGICAGLDDPLGSHDIWGGMLR